MAGRNILIDPNWAMWLSVVKRARRPGLSLHELPPIDLVLMTGDRLGDRSSELERLLIRHYRWKHLVPDERVTVVAPPSGSIDPPKTVRFDFAAADAGKRSLASLQPLLVRLRRLVTRARASRNALRRGLRL